MAPTGGGNGDPGAVRAAVKHYRPAALSPSSTAGNQLALLSPVRICNAAGGKRPASGAGPVTRLRIASSGSTAGNQVVQLPSVESQRAGGGKPACGQNRESLAGWQNRETGKPCPAGWQNWLSIAGGQRRQTRQTRPSSARPPSRQCRPSANSQPSQTWARRSRYLMQNELATNRSPTPHNGSHNPEHTNPALGKPFPVKALSQTRASQTTAYPQTPAPLWIPQHTNHFSVPPTNLTGAQDANRRKVPPPAAGNTE